MRTDLMPHIGSPTEYAVERLATDILEAEGVDPLRLVYYPEVLTDDDPRYLRLIEMQRPYGVVDGWGTGPEGQRFRVPTDDDGVDMPVVPGTRRRKR